jgi:hypothetical protein
MPKEVLHTKNREYEHVKQIQYFYTAISGHLCKPRLHCHLWQLHQLHATSVMQYLKTLNFTAFLETS